jgi:hypothetical protein
MPKSNRAFASSLICRHPPSGAQSGSATATAAVQLFGREAAPASTASRAGDLIYLTNIPCARCPPAYSLLPLLPLRPLCGQERRHVWRLLSRGRNLVLVCCKRAHAKGISVRRRKKRYILYTHPRRPPSSESTSTRRSRRSSLCQTLLTYPHLATHQQTHYGYLLHQSKLQLCEYS